MPLLDIATAQPSLRNYIYTFRSETLFHGKFVFGNEKRLAASSWRTFRIPEKFKNFNLGGIDGSRGELVIKAVATLEHIQLARGNDKDEAYQNLPIGVNSGSSSQVVEHQSSSEDSTELDEREKLRRMRISKANKGNTPWNKGRKHSPETLQRIKERTRLAMQDPKVKMKLVNLGHAQSKETRFKIGVGVRLGWERRRGKQRVQETCHFEWQNLIAEASRRGFVGEEELQWDSYKILDEQLEQEWLESVEERKKMPRPKCSKRAPKSAEQRRKISEAIAAKWADPAYRDRVYSGLSKYHGTPIGVERKLKRRPSGDRELRKKSPVTKRGNDMNDSAGSETKSENLQPRLKRANAPMYKDPLSNSKLEMIKNIRAQRAATETKKSEAITRAKQLIAEAEKAAKALEVAATRSPLAHASLIETRKLIAEAVESIESIESGGVNSDEENRSSGFTSSGRVNHVEERKYGKIKGLSQADHREVNGTYTISSTQGGIMDFNFSNFTLEDILNGKNVLPKSSDNYGLLNGKEELYSTSSSDNGLLMSSLDGMINHSSFTKQTDHPEPNGSKRHEQKLLPNGTKSQSGKEETPNNSVTMTKKWVCGRLVDDIL
ncbi:unnamed protein product [Ilex paraguariensis]|uniref:Nuclease associated modular domain-containing protein n=1 Tax=Ilex paraguariensis TaxID=185542 RepID=A0ABC8RI88_9AQUA